MRGPGKIPMGISEKKEDAEQPVPLPSRQTKMAERGGFEPPNGNIPLTVFETAAFDRSAISPDFAKKAMKYTIPRKNKKSKRDRVFLLFRTRRQPILGSGLNGSNAALLRDSMRPQTFYREVYSSYFSMYEKKMGLIFRDLRCTLFSLCIFFVQEIDDEQPKQHERGG